MGLAVQEIEAAERRPDIAIGHLGLRVSKLKETLEFFKLVGARVVVQMPGMGILELRGGTHVILRYDPHANSDYAGFDLMIDDIVEMRQRLIAAGFSPTELSHGGVHHSFQVKEPSGLVMDFTSSHATGIV